MSGLDWLGVQRLTPMLQSEGTECGLACVAMIAAYHGHDVNLSGLRQRFPISAKGATLAELMGIASELELAPRALRLEVDEIDKLQVPAILHWDLNHFVVLERPAGRGGAVILDPATGRRQITAEELSRGFTGVALELSPTPAFKPIEAHRRTRLSDLWSRLSNFRGAITQVLVLSLLLQITALVMPFFLQLSVDQAITRADADLMLLLLVAFGIVYALNAVIRGLRSWVVLTVGQSVSFHLGGNIVRHLLRLPLDYFERRHMGDLISRVGSIQPIQSLLTQGLVNVVIDSLLALITLVVMFLISPLLGLLVVGTTVAYLVMGALMYPGLRRRTQEEIIARANEETFLMESIRGMRTIKLHGFEAMRENTWRNRYAEVISAGYKAKTYGIRLDLAEDVLFGLQFLLIVYLGALSVMQQGMTVGLLFAFISYRSSFTRSAVALVDQWQRWRLLGVHLERLSDIVGEQPEQLSARPRLPVLAPAAIRLEAVSLAYGRNDMPVLDRLDLTVPKGAFVAIVGPSGAGKTTLMRVMLGLLPPTSGRVLIDGVPLGPGSTAAWRSRIGAVLQDDQLLTGTFGDNISFFDPQATEERVVAAARQARIHDEIVRLPMGYLSLVGDMGSALSGGQRQRLMLARALYRRPDVLFLDEGTANLDEEAENAIADYVQKLPITRIVVAHRPALVARADVVYRLEDGRLVPAEKPGAGFGKWASLGGQQVLSDADILVLDPDGNSAAETKTALEDMGVRRVHPVATLTEALAVLAHHPIDAALAAFGRDSSDGLQFVRLMRDAYQGRFQTLPVILTGGYPDRDCAAMAREAGADGFCRKPYDLAALQSKLRFVLGEPLPHPAIANGARSSADVSKRPSIH